MPTPDKPDVKHRVFNLDGFSYTIYATQVLHRDYDTLYQAWRTTLATGERSPVVLKRLPVPSDGERRHRYWEEVQMATYLKHPGIAKVHGITVSPDRTTYVVMENMPGVYLATALDWHLLSGKKVSPAFAAYVAAMVADALAHAHGLRDTSGNALHIIHRAVGPMRIRLGFDGRVKLTNFGAAYSELRDRWKTPPGIMRGDAAYAAPELWCAVMSSLGPLSDPLIAGTIDGKVDVFSLGFVLLEMLAGYPLDPPDALDPAHDLRREFAVKTERPTWTEPSILAERVLGFSVDQVERQLASLPNELQEILRLALQPDPVARLDAAAMRYRLLAYLAGLRRPYDEKAMGQELGELYDAVKSSQRLQATPIERTALSSRDDMGG